MSRRSGGTTVGAESARRSHSSVGKAARITPAERSEASDPGCHRDQHRAHARAGPRGAARAYATGNSADSRPGAKRHWLIERLVRSTDSRDPAPATVRGHTLRGFNLFHSQGADVDF